MEKDYTVDDTLMESAPDDAAQVPETDADALSTALESIAPEAAAEAGQQEADGDLKEPEDGGLRGRMKQFEKRGYNRAMKEWAERERGYQERLAKYEQMELEADAKEFAQKNNIPENFALEYMRMKRGLPAEGEQQPRDDAGRFVERAPSEPAADTAAQERASVLMTQAEAFEKMSDGRVTRDDILNAFQGDAEMRQKVVSGEWDFTDVGRALSGGRQRAPKVSRSASNGQIQNSTFMGMSDEDFARFDERIRQGAVFDARR